MGIIFSVYNYFKGLLIPVSENIKLLYQIKKWESSKDIIFSAQFDNSQKLFLFSKSLIAKHKNHNFYKEILFNDEQSNNKMRRESTEKNYSKVDKIKFNKQNLENAILQDLIKKQRFEIINEELCNNEYLNECKLKIEISRIKYNNKSSLFHFSSKGKNYYILFVEVQKDQKKQIYIYNQFIYYDNFEQGIIKNIFNGKGNIFNEINKLKNAPNVLYKDIRINLDHNIYKFFKALFNSNLKFQESKDNKIKCKLANIGEYIKYFFYKEYDKSWSYTYDYDKDNDDWVNKNSNFNSIDIDNNQFYIIDEECLFSLSPLIINMNLGDFPDYQIINNKDKVILMKDKNNAYEFKIGKNINDRKNIQKIDLDEDGTYVKDSKKRSIYLDISNTKSIISDNKINIQLKKREEIDINKEKEENFKLREKLKKYYNELNKVRMELEQKNKLEEEYQNNIDDLKKDNNALRNQLYDLGEKNNEKVNQLNQKLYNYQEKSRKEKKDIKDQYIKTLDIVNIDLSKNNKTAGSDNLGATCYMNATLQCMAHFKEVSEYILRLYKFGDRDFIKSKPVTYEYAKVLDNFYFPQGNNNKGGNKYISYSAKEFRDKIAKMNPLFKENQANDSKDLLNYLIESMHLELNEIKFDANANKNVILDQTNEEFMYNAFIKEYQNNNNSILSRYLYAIQKIENCCCNCQITMYNFQAYNFLIFPLLEVKKFVYYENYQNPNFVYQNYIITIADCFRYFEKVENFTGENQIFCNICQSLENAKHRTSLISSPIILTLVLNRGKGNKDFSEPIYIPKIINLSQYVQKTEFPCYYLIGLIVHVGESSMNGHFFAYCRNNSESPWYKYNDSMVDTVKNDNELFATGTPYILFYRKYK